MTGFRVPTIPNSPLNSSAKDQAYGFMKLRVHPALGFIENASFEPALATYDDGYQNSQAHSERFVRHMTDVLTLLKAEFPKASRMVEVGCGKGSFVDLVELDQHFTITGYDATYEGNNPLIEKRYLTAADKLDADVVVLRHVLEHIKAPHTFLTMLANIFRDAKIYIEVPNYDWIKDNRAFFDITYEHVNYFTKRSLGALFDDKAIKSGLLFDEQYQFVIAKLDSISEKFGVHYSSDNWEDLDFDILFSDISEKITSIEARLGKTGKLYVWGAATKGCMFLVHCFYRNRLIDRVGFAIDQNPQKCGKFLPGSLVPIWDKEKFYASVKNDDLLLISNPNYKDEILVGLRENGLDRLKIVTL